MTEYTERLVPAVGDRAPMNVFAPNEEDLQKKKPEDGWRLIIGHPGIGEQIKRASLTDLQVNGTWTACERRVKENGKYILIEVQPTNNYEHGETDEAYEWARKEYGDLINWDRVYITGLSLGGGGIQRYLSVNPNAHEKFAAAVALCPGPNQFFILDKNYKNIAESKVPLWLIHCADDKTAPLTMSTLKTVARCRKINPNALIITTILNSGGHAAWTMGYGGNPICTPATAKSDYTATIDGVEEEFKLFNNPKAGFLEFFESNVRGKAPVKPEAITYQAAKPIPIPPVPVNEPIYELDSFYVASDGTPYGHLVEFYWTPDKKVSSILKADEGDRISGVYLHRPTGVVTVDFDKANPLPVGPKKNI